jgi:addiction module HigA family antidote
MLEKLTAYSDKMHREHVERERVRHAEFAAKLRDVALAPEIVEAASQQVADWEMHPIIPSEHINGWRAVLALEPNAIAQLLEEHSYPLLHVRHGRSPFWREPTEEEHRRTIDKIFHRGEFGRLPAKLKDKCRLSVDGINDRRYCVFMSDADFTHPGALVRQNCLERFELSVTEGARVLGVSRQALTNLLSGKAGISPEMALRLDLAFGGGAETWLQRQVLHDLAEARKRLAQFKVVPIALERQPALF